MRVRLLLLASLSIGSALAATSWSRWSAAFPATPCQDGWAACRTAAGPHGGGTVRDRAGRPIPADARLAWFDLEPTAVFSPFGGLSQYTGAAQGAVAAMADPGSLSVPAAVVPAVVADPGSPAGRPEDPVAPAPPVSTMATPVSPSPFPVTSAPTSVAPTTPTVAPTTLAPSTVPPPSTVVVVAPPATVSVSVAPAPVATSPVVTPTAVASLTPTPVAPTSTAPPVVTPTTLLVPVQVGCDDLVALEPAAMIGQLTSTQVSCLEAKVDGGAGQTTKDKLSRVLIANAEGRGDKAEWERLMKRHLEEIDRSDPDLCFRYALQLSRGGVGRAPGVIRWTETALDNKHRWEGSTYKKRVFDLYRLRAEAGNRLWTQAEQEFTTGDHSEANQAKAERYRGVAKDYAREWLDYAAASGQDTRTALALCVSAAGNRSFCEGG